MERHRVLDFHSDLSYPKEALQTRLVVLVTGLSLLIRYTEEAYIIED